MLFGICQREPPSICCLLLSWKHRLLPLCAISGPTRSLRFGSLHFAAYVSALFNYSGGRKARYLAELTSPSKVGLSPTALCYVFLEHHDRARCAALIDTKVTQWKNPFSTFNSIDGTTNIIEFLISSLEAIRKTTGYQ